MKLHLGSGMAGSGHRSRSRRHIKHRQHQANKLRKLAARCDDNIIRLQNRKRSMLALAAKLEEQCHGTEVVKYKVGD